jgi:biotin-dependent carboxylase-like uncharacterized protein
MTAETAYLRIMRPGIQTTVQDVGRGGFLGDGIPPSGAFDLYSLRLANLLVGNETGGSFLVGRDPGAAGLEILLGGASLSPSRDVLVAVTGAEAEVTVDDEPQAMWESFVVPEEATLRIGAPHSGLRVYLAIAGGIDVPLVLGSRATNPRASLGGFHGRKLSTGDDLAIAALANGTRPPPGSSIARELRPELRTSCELRVILGPQDELFTQESISLFLSTEWQLSPLADRMGCRFVGPPLEFRPRPAYLVEQAGADPSNIVDDVTPVGGVQVPSGLEPIVMGVDVPSIGGYAKIATVVSSDLSRLAQVRPGSTVRFRAIELTEAVEAVYGALAAVTERALVAPGGSRP